MVKEEKNEVGAMFAYEIAELEKGQNFDAKLSLYKILKKRNFEYCRSVF